MQTCLIEVNKLYYFYTSSVYGLRKVTYRQKKVYIYFIFDYFIHSCFHLIKVNYSCIH